MDVFSGAFTPLRGRVLLLFILQQLPCLRQLLLLQLLPLPNAKFSYTFSPCLQLLLGSGFKAE